MFNVLHDPVEHNWFVEFSSVAFSCPDIAPKHLTNVILLGPAFVSVTFNNIHSAPGGDDISLNCCLNCKEFSPATVGIWKCAPNHDNLASGGENCGAVNDTLLPVTAARFRASPDVPELPSTTASPNIKLQKISVQNADLVDTPLFSTKIHLANDHKNYYCAANCTNSISFFEQSETVIFKCF